MSDASAAAAAAADDAAPVPFSSTKRPAKPATKRTYGKGSTNTLAACPRAPPERFNGTQTTVWKQVIHEFSEMGIVFVVFNRGLYDPWGPISITCTDNIDRGKHEMIVARMRDILVACSENRNSTSSRVRHRSFWRYNIVASNAARGAKTAAIAAEVPDLRALYSEAAARLKKMTAAFAKRIQAHVVGLPGCEVVAIAVRPYLGTDLKPAMLFSTTMGLTHANINTMSATARVAEILLTAHTLRPSTGNLVRVSMLPDREGDQTLVTRE
jgi:hypothetical protein